MKVKDDAVCLPGTYPKEPSILTYLLDQHRKAILLCPCFICVTCRPEAILKLPHVDGSGDKLKCIISENAPPAFVRSGSGELGHEQLPCQKECCRYKTKFVS